MKKHTLGRINQPVLVMALCLLATFCIAEDQQGSKEPLLNDKAVKFNRLPTSRNPLNDRIKVLGGRLLLDGYIEATGVLQSDKYLDLVGVSTPTVTVSTNHAQIWLNDSARSICARFDNASSYCFAAGSASAFLTESSAAVTYLQLSSATATYITQSSVTATYLTQSSATASYVTYSSGTVLYAKLGSNNTWTGFNKFTSSMSYKGTTSADNPSTGYVGEVLSTSTSVNITAPSSDVIGDLLSMTITPGDWDCSLMGYAIPNGATWTYIMIGLSTTSGDSSTGLVNGDNKAEEDWGSTSVSVTGKSPSVPSVRVNISASTTYYFKVQTGYTLGSPRVRGRLTCRRKR